MKKVWIRNIDEAIDFFSDFGVNFAFDTETTSSAIRAFRCANGYTKSLPEDLGRQALDYYYLELEAMSFCDGKKAGFIMFEYIRVSDFLSIFMGHIQRAKTIIAHNIAYDMKVLKKYGISLEDKKIYCTMVADHLIDETRSHSLKNLAASLLGVKETMKWGDARAAGGKTFFEYAINDAVWTWELCMLQQHALKREGLVKLFREIEMPFQFVLLDMETEGFEIDRAACEETTKVLLQAKEDFTTQMLEYLGERFQIQMNLDGTSTIISPINFESPSQLAEICEKRLGLECVERTPGGAYSVGKVFMNTYAQHEFISTLKKYKIASQLYKLFFKPLPSMLAPDGRVRASFNDIGTKTGRLSCSSPNLQQLAKPDKRFPIETRAAFIAGEGRKMITCDFSGQEICIMVEESGDENMKKILLDNQDPHLKTAKEAFDADIPSEALSRDHPEYPNYVNKFKAERNKAKIFNFSLPYGKGAYGFAKDYGITEDEAQKILDKYFRANFKLKEAIDKAQNEVRERGYVTYLSGRKRHFQKVKKDDWEGYTKKSMRQAFNAKVQGFGADMMRMALNSVRSEAKKRPELDIKIHATVHDEGVFTCRADAVEEASKLIKNCFESCVKFSVPILAEIGTGDNYAQAK